jgi:hypothetical protein
VADGIVPGLPDLKDEDITGSCSGLSLGVLPRCLFSDFELEILMAAAATPFAMTKL